MTFHRLALVLVTALVAGCGSSGAAKPEPTATATASAAPTASSALTSNEDVAACAQLERLVQAVSLVVGHTTEGITQALHPRELAEKIDTAQHSLLDSARVIEVFKAPGPLVSSQRDYAQGLRMFAADFARAKATTRRGDMAKATEQLTDEPALKKISGAAKKIDELCGR